MMAVWFLISPISGSSEPSNSLRYLRNVRRSIPWTLAADLPDFPRRTAAVSVSKTIRGVRPREVFFCEIFGHFFQPENDYDSFRAGPSLRG